MKTSVVALKQNGTTMTRLLEIDTFGRFSGKISLLVCYTQRKLIFLGVFLAKFKAIVVRLEFDTFERFY